MFLLFLGVWIILNGRVTLEILLFGIPISAVMFLFCCKFMDYSIKKDLLLFRRSFLLIGYCVVLVWEIVKANFGVIRLIYTSEYELEPALIYFTSPLKSKMLNALLANSITLTPGTITVSAEDGEFSVHCLDKDLGEGMEDSIFVKMLLKIEATDLKS